MFERLIEKGFKIIAYDINEIVVKEIIKLGGRGNSISERGCLSLLDYISKSSKF